MLRLATVAHLKLGQNPSIERPFKNGRRQTIGSYSARKTVTGGVRVAR
jgi:hypothetical protein